MFSQRKSQSEPNPKGNQNQSPPPNPQKNPYQVDGKIVGFRGWVLNEQYRLRSPHAGTIWPTEPEKATDHHLRDGRGWYAYYSMALSQSLEFAPWKGAKMAQQVNGVITAWGEVFIHPDGFRAEYAQVVALCYDRKWPKPFIAAIRAIASEYGARTVDSFDAVSIAGEYGNILTQDFYYSLPSNMYNYGRD